jgi:fucose permease
VSWGQTSDHNVAVSTPVPDLPMLPASLTPARRATFLLFALLGLGVNSWLVRIPDVKAALGISAGSLGLTLLVGALGTVLAIGPAGREAARRGSAPVVRFGALSFAVSVAMLGLATTHWMLAVALFAFGAFAAILDVAMNSHAVTLEKAYRSSHMNRFHGVYSIGALIGVGVGGLLAQAQVAVSIHLTLTGVVIAVVAMAALPRLLPDGVDRHHRIPGEVRGRWPFALVLMGLIGMAAAIGEGAAGDWSAVHLREELGASPFIGALPLAGFTLTMVIGRLAGDALSNRIRSQWLLGGCALLAGVGLVLGLISGTVVGTIAGWTIAGLGLSVMIPLLFSAAGQVPGVPQAHGLAAVTGVTYLGFVAGPPLVGLLAEEIGLGRALLVPAVLVLLTVALIPAALRGRK